MNSVRPVPASVLARLIAFVSLFIGTSATAQDSLETLLHQTQMLQQEIHQLKSDYKAQVSALERRILELEVSARSPRHLSQSTMVTSDDKVTEKEGRQHQADASLTWTFAGLSSVGGSTASAKELELLQGGSHDPRKNGFTVQAAALAARADFGEHLSAVATIVSYIEPNGESVVELGPAYFQATSLPLDLSLKVGLRAEFADSNQNSSGDPFRGNRRRMAINLTYPVTPSFWWRLQYNRDRADFLDDTSAHSIWLQLGYQAGEHNEH